MRFPTLTKPVISATFNWVGHLFEFSRCGSGSCLWAAKLSVFCNGLM